LKPSVIFLEYPTFTLAFIRESTAKAGTVFDGERTGTVLLSRKKLIVKTHRRMDCMLLRRFSLSVPDG